MSESKHTPPPWTLEIPDFEAAEQSWIDRHDEEDGYEVYRRNSHAALSSPGWKNFAEVAVVVNGEADEAGMANARLIAAAPDMLAELRQDLSFFQTLYEDLRRIAGPVVNAAIVDRIKAVGGVIEKADCKPEDYF